MHLRVIEAIFLFILVLVTALSIRIKSIHLRLKLPWRCPICEVQRRSVHHIWHHVWIIRRQTHRRYHCFGILSFLSFLLILHPLFNCLFLFYFIKESHDSRVLLFVSGNSVLRLIYYRPVSSSRRYLKIGIDIITISCTMPWDLNISVQLSSLLYLLWNAPEDITVIAISMWVIFLITFDEPITRILLAWIHTLKLYRSISVNILP